MNTARTSLSLWSVLENKCFYLNQDCSRGDKDLEMELSALFYMENVTRLSNGRVKSGVSVTFEKEIVFKAMVNSRWLIKQFKTVCDKQQQSISRDLFYAHKLDHSEERIYSAEREFYPEEK